MVNKQTEKAKIVSEKAPYDFVGHISYPFKPEVWNLMFYKQTYKTIDIVRNEEGKLLCKRKLDVDFRKILETQGFQIEPLQVPSSVNRSFEQLQVPCTKTNCLYYNETTSGVCKIKIKAIVEVLRKTHGEKEAKKQILLTFKARDMDETALKNRCLLKYVFSETGIAGSPDTYGKIQLC